MPCSREEVSCEAGLSDDRWPTFAFVWQCGIAKDAPGHHYRLALVLPPHFPTEGKYGPPVKANAAGVPTAYDRAASVTRKLIWAGVSRLMREFEDVAIRLDAIGYWHDGLRLDACIPSAWLILRGRGDGERPSSTTCELERRPYSTSAIPIVALAAMASVEIAT